VTEYIPPHDLEVEAVLLGACLHWGGTVRVAADLLSTGDFYDERNRLVFAAIKELHGMGKHIDAAVLKDHLKRSTILDDPKGVPVEYVMQLSTSPDGPGTEKELCEIILDHSCRRRDIEKLEAATIQARKGGDYSDELRALLNQNNGSKPRLETVTAAELQTMQFPPLTYVVDRLLPAGLCFFAGAFKSGKSWMSLQLGLAVARGDDFFGEKTSQGDVLLVAAEDNQQRLQSRIVKLHKGEWPDTLHLATGIPRLDDGGIEELERFHDDHPELRLVGLDVWQSVRGKERSRNQYADDYSAIEDIQNFASDHGVAVLILHHHRKAPDVDTFNKFSGSTGIMGSADTGWSLERERGQCDASFITTGRDIKELELALSFDEDTCEWIGLGPLDEYQHSQEKSKIIRVLRDSGPIGPKDIAEALDKNVSTIRTYLGRMLDAGEIEKVGRGEYVAKESVTLTDFKESS
jgi:hypothetical protein